MNNGVVPGTLEHLQLRVSSLENEVIQLKYMLSTFAPPSSAPIASSSSAPVSLPSLSPMASPSSEPASSLEVPGPGPCLPDGTGWEMIEAAQSARVDHLKKLAETGVCDLPNGKDLKDTTLQFLSDLTPDGRNKELFLCRRCGFVAPNHMWHQAKKDGIMQHHFRCRRCFAMYLPWQQNSKWCRFNKVLVHSDPDDSDKYIITPAWWTETSEQLFVNILKELTFKIQTEDAEMKAVTYDNITKIISEKIDACYNQTTVFQQIDVPGPYMDQVATLTNCKGFEHCDITPQKIEGFFFKNHMDVKEDEIFKDFAVLCDELASCLKNGDA